MSPSNSLAQSIRSLLAPIEGEWAVAARSVRGPDWTLMMREHKSVHAASTMKVPVMVECYRQAHEECLDLDDTLRIENEFRSIADGSRYRLLPENDSHVSLYNHIGDQRRIRTLMHDMITISSNLATNLLIRRVGPENVSRTMQQLGADGIQVRRGVEDLAAHRRDSNNETTAHGLLVLLEHIARGTAVCKEACAEMIDILKAQKHNTIIPTHLPEDVTVAHKTGWITGVRHDAGIVFVPEGPTYVLVLLSNSVSDVDVGVSALAQISRLVFDAAVEKT